jgi:hypothetical protein
MGGKGEYRGLDIALDSDGPEAPEDRGAPGREHDVQGSPVHVPHRNLGSREVLTKLLDDDQLEIVEAPRGEAARMVRPNPAGLKKGYDPYESGLLVKQERRRKKDLRALSEWIKARKRAQSGER